MPALRGSLTYVRYFVEGALPDDFQERSLKSIRLRAMRPLDPNEEVSERSGWCRLGEPMDTDLDFEDVFYNSYVNLGLRTDRWVIPGALVRARMREAEKAYLQKKGRERLGRKERAELKELVVKKLRREMTPVTRAFDVSWSLDEGIVRFFTHAARHGAALEALFAKTFSLKLVAEGPYTLAARIGLRAEQEKRWEAIEPIELAVEGP
jgi:recombination associated protein RdgC